MTIITIGAVHPNSGLMDYNIDEAQVAQAMIANTGAVMVLADSSKLGRRAAFKEAALEAADFLVTERELGNEWTRPLKAANVVLK